LDWLQRQQFPLSRHRTPEQIAGRFPMVSSLLGSLTVHDKRAVPSIRSPIWRGVKADLQQNLGPAFNDT
jgi:hypothetical protein